MITEVISVANPNTGTMYLRGVPRKLVREAKVEAARRGTTLAALVAEALDRFLGTAQAERPEAIDPIADDLKWFEANRSRLFRRYPNEYVAIMKRKVVDHDRDFSALTMRVYEKYGVRSVAMPKVTQQERVVNLPSPSIER
jgi:hypothetical protein